MTELICIVCPKGCHLHVDEEHGLKISGNSCEKGIEYGTAEMTHPTRVLTSMVKAEGKGVSCCPVKTNGTIPKQDIFRAMDTLKQVVVKAPVKIGDVIVENVCGTGTDWVATKNIR